MCLLCTLKLGCTNRSARNFLLLQRTNSMMNSTLLIFPRHFSVYISRRTDNRKSGRYLQQNIHGEHVGRNPMNPSQRNPFQRNDPHPHSLTYKTGAGPNSIYDVHEEGAYSFQRQIMKSRKVQNLIKDLRIPHNEVVNILDELSTNLKSGSVDSEEGVDAAKNYIHERFQELDRKERVKRRAMTVKKFFPKPKVDNLLTWSAKEQIRYLHRESPEIWNPESLASSFPCTVDQVKDVLKDRKIMYEAADVENHDKLVLRNWEAIAAGDTGKLQAETVKLLQDGTISSVRYSEGNPSLPSPPPTVPQTVPLPAVKSGLFSMLIQDHLKPAESNSNQLAAGSNERKLLPYRLNEEVVCSDESMRLLPRANVPSQGVAGGRREKLDVSAGVAYKSPPSGRGRGAKTRVTFREFARRHSLSYVAQQDTEFLTMKTARDYVGSYQKEEYLTDPSSSAEKGNGSLRRESLFDRIKKEAKDLLRAKSSSLHQHHHHQRDKVSPKLERRSSLEERKPTFRVPDFKFPVNSISLRDRY